MWCVLCLHQIIVDDDDSKVWSLYDAGPKNVRCPLIFLPPVSGTAEVFFHQMLALTGWGYRVISVSVYNRKKRHYSFSFSSLLQFHILLMSNLFIYKEVYPYNHVLVPVVWDTHTHLSFSSCLYGPVSSKCLKCNELVHCQMCSQSCAWE